jgi:hypothetical protein
MKGNERYWGGGISIISQNFSKSPSILFHALESSISQTSLYRGAEAGNGRDRAHRGRETAADIDEQRPSMVIMVVRLLLEE